MKKVKEIYLAKERLEGMSIYSTGIIFVTEDNEVYEAISTDVMEQFTKSKINLSLLTPNKE
jgi:hypothetical protein